MAHLHIGSCMYVHMYACMYVQYVFMYMYKHAEGCRLKACQFTVFMPQRRRCTVLIIQLVLHKVCIDINIMNDGKPHAKLPFLLSPSASTFALPFRLLTLLMPKRRKAHSSLKILIINIVSCMRRRFDNNKINAIYLILPRDGHWKIRSPMQLTSTMRLIKHYKCRSKANRRRICDNL